ncbi:MAG: hypothetical protein OEN23_19945 [Paracoccaceae bacterium]|nr:hypothetical protein [Paracoccaceae bacterium]
MLRFLAVSKFEFHFFGGIAVLRGIDRVDQPNNPSHVMHRSNQASGNGGRSPKRLVLPAEVVEHEIERQGMEEVVELL